MIALSLQNTNKCVLSTQIPFKINGFDQELLFYSLAFHYSLQHKHQTVRFLPIDILNRMKSEITG